MAEVKDAVIIGAGSAGLAVAVGLRKQGARNIVLLEREDEPGGILRQCIHDGFGLIRFGEKLSGPEYADRFIAEAAALGVDIQTRASVIGLTRDKRVTAVTRQGLKEYQAKAVILAMGCRERTRGALGIPGVRAAGIYTAGVVQAFVNLRNLMPARNAVILGSGDVGLIVARRLTLEGCKVSAVIEKLPYPSGLPRNVQQCLRDFDIPLYLSHTVTDIKGDARIQSVEVSALDDEGIPVPGSAKEFPCDTLVLSVGLIPENELSRMADIELDPCTGGPLVDEFYQTSQEGIFAAGNVLHIHDLVDHVSVEGEKLALAAAEYIHAGKLPACPIRLEPGAGVSSVVPQWISGDRDVDLDIRVSVPAMDKRLTLRQGGVALKSMSYRKVNPPETIRVRLESNEINARVSRDQATRDQGIRDKETREQRTRDQAIRVVASGDQGNPGDPDNPGDQDNPGNPGADINIQVMIEE